MTALFFVAVAAISARAADSIAAGPINAGEVALERSHLFLGLAKLCQERGMELPPSLVAVDQFTDTIPFIGDDYVGRSAWRITYPEFDALLHSLDDVSAKPTKLRSCVVWIDSLTGVFLQAGVYADESDSDTIADLTWSELRDEARSNGDRYVQFVGAAPKVSMLEALKKSPHKMLYATRLIVRCVSVSHMSSQAHPAWIVHMIGGGGLLISPESDGIVSTRLVVNAQTGEAPPAVDV